MHVIQLAIMLVAYSSAERLRCHGLPARLWPGSVCTPVLCRNYDHGPDQDESEAIPIVLDA